MLIICAGMLRSGSALQYNLVCSLVEKVGPGIRHGRIDTEKEWLSHPALAWAQDSKTCHVVKAVIIQPQELQMVRDGRVRICYIYRDIRDVAAAAKVRWNVSGDRWDYFLPTLDLLVKRYEDLEGLKGTPYVLHQRYEDVVSDVPRAVLEIARLLGVTPSQQIIEKVVTECSLEAMEKISRSKVLHFNHLAREALGNVAIAVKRVLPPPLNGSWRLRKLMLRVLPKIDRRTLVGYKHIETTRGEPGTWRSQLDKEEQEVITARYKGYLIRTGYSLEEQGRDAICIG